MSRSEFRRSHARSPDDMELQKGCRAAEGDVEQELRSVIGLYGVSVVLEVLFRDEGLREVLLELGLDPEELLDALSERLDLS